MGVKAKHIGKTAFSSWNTKTNETKSTPVEPRLSNQSTFIYNINWFDNESVIEQFSM